MRRLIPIFARLGFYLPVLFAIDVSVAQEQVEVVAFRCEAFCSESKLRTANARLIWIGPGMPLGASALGGRQVQQEQIETTVFKNGFRKNLQANFPVLDSAVATAKAMTPSVGAAAKLPAYQLQIIEAQKPAIAGASARRMAEASPQQQERSLVIEGLEPGLTYYWRLRFQTADGWAESQAIACEAPVCPADMQP